MVWYGIDLDAHAAGVGVGTVAETPEPDRTLKTEANWAGISCSVAGVGDR
jgi:hypothetical protein